MASQVYIGVGTGGAGRARAHPPPHILPSRPINIHTTAQIAAIVVYITFGPPMQNGIASYTYARMISY